MAAWAESVRPRDGGGKAGGPGGRGSELGHQPEEPPCLGVGGMLMEAWNWGRLVRAERGTQPSPRLGQNGGFRVRTDGGRVEGLL